jgi:hypothetical protein
VPNVSKKKGVPSKEKERKREKKSMFLEFGVSKCIPYDSFMFPPSAQWVFFHVPYVPNSSTLYPICFGQVPLLCKTI